MATNAQRRLRSVFLLLTGTLAIVASQGCNKDGGSTGEPPAASAAAPTTKPKAGEGAPASPVNTGFGLPLAANKCPSAAPGATTTVKETADGAEVTVTAPGGTPINDIRQRGVQIVAAAKDPGTGVGSSADGLARCPIVVKDTIVTETDIPGGAMFTVKPKQSTGLADLKKETKARAASYEAPK